MNETFVKFIIIICNSVRSLYAQGGKGDVGGDNNQMIQYLYLCIPISLLLNTFGFVLIELHKFFAVNSSSGDVDRVSKSRIHNDEQPADDDSDGEENAMPTREKSKTRALVKSIVRGLLLNPLLGAIVVGIIGREK